jgi:glycosyltransferase involved in cell wall biosynthesis
MTKRVLLCLSHSIEEFMQLDLLSSLGYEVASIGGYIDPSAPHDPKRPALDVPFYPEIKAAVDALGTPDNLTAAQELIPRAVLDWLGNDGIIIYHHNLDRLFGQWPYIRDWMRATHGRAIWRSVGQSVAFNERAAQPYRITGLERVAYSPRETRIPDYSGEDALIRFWGAQDDEPWIGDERIVIQLSQHLRQREPFTNWAFWDSATRDLSRRPLGPGSEAIGGPGQLPYDDMRAALRHSRAFLFTGSQPASYTLGLIEAMHAGIPTISIGPAWMRVMYDEGEGGHPHTSSELFEGHELAPYGFDDPNLAHQMLRRLLADDDFALGVSAETQAIARRLFDRTAIGAQWKAFLG